MVIYINNGYVNANNINNNTLDYNGANRKKGKGKGQGNQFRTSLSQIGQTATRFVRDLSMGRVQMGSFLSRHSARDVVRQHVQKRHFDFTLSISTGETIARPCSRYNVPSSLFTDVRIRADR